MFTVKGESLDKWRHLSGAPLWGRLLLWPANIRLGRISLPGTNIIPYYEYS